MQCRNHKPTARQNTQTQESPHKTNNFTVCGTSKCTRKSACHHHTPQSLEFQSAESSSRKWRSSSKIEPKFRTRFQHWTQYKPPWILGNQDDFLFAWADETKDPIFFIELYAIIRFIDLFLINLFFQAKSYQNL